MNSTMSFAMHHGSVVLSFIKAVKYTVFVRFLNFFFCFKWKCNVEVHLVVGWFGSWLITIKDFILNPYGKKEWENASEIKPADKVDGHCYTVLDNVNPWLAN